MLKWLDASGVNSVTLVDSPDRTRSPSRSRSPSRGAASFTTPSRVPDDDAVRLAMKVCVVVCLQWGRDATRDAGVQVDDLEAQARAMKRELSAERVGRNEVLQPARAGAARCGSWLGPPRAHRCASGGWQVERQLKEAQRQIAEANGHTSDRAIALIEEQIENERLWTEEMQARMCVDVWTYVCTPRARHRWWPLQPPECV